MKTILFKSQEYLFGGDSLNESGFIATKEQFDNFQESFAHYFPEVGVLRYGQKIGEAKDIVFKIKASAK